MWVKPWIFLYCLYNLLARVHMRPLCSPGSAFEHESVESVPAQWRVASSPQSCMSLFESPIIFLCQDCRDCGFFHLPCHWGVSPRLLGEDPTRCQQTAWSGGGTHPPGESGWVPQLHNRTRSCVATSEGSTATQIGKNLGSNSDVPQEAEEETDQLPKTPSNCLLGWKTGLSGLGSWMKVCETPQGIREVELFLGNSHNWG
jgi:hypothetical protein